MQNNHCARRGACVAHSYSKCTSRSSTEPKGVKPQWELSSSHCSIYLWPSGDEHLSTRQTLAARCRESLLHAA